MTKTAITPLKLARYREILTGPVRPIHWDVDPSSACDHACRGCPYIFTGEFDPMLGVARPQMLLENRTLLDFDVFLSFLEQAIGHGVKAITFVGGGEPTLHPRFTEMMERTHARGVKFGVITHLGRKYKPAFFEALARATWVRVSVNAGMRDTYLKHQGKDCFEQVLENTATLALVRDLDPAVSASGCRIGWSFLITNDNYKEIHSARYAAQKAGADFIQFKPIIEVGVPGAAYAGLERSIADMLTKSKLFNSVPSFQVLDQWSSRLAELKQHAEKKFSGACSVPRFNPKLGANGVVYTCCELAYSDEAALGCIYDEPLSIILERAGKRCGQIDMVRCPHCWDKPVNTMINAGEFDLVQPPSESTDQEFV